MKTYYLYSCEESVHGWIKKYILAEKDKIKLIKMTAEWQITKAVFRKMKSNQRFVEPGQIRLWGDLTASELSAMVDVLNGTTTLKVVPEDEL